MGVGGENGEMEKWGLSENKLKLKNNDNKEDDHVEEGGGEEESGCWLAWKFFGSCISSRSKIDSSATGTNSAETKSTANTSQDDHPTAPVILSSSTITTSTTTTTSTSNVGSSWSTFKTEDANNNTKTKEELKISTGLRKFAFNDLKQATRNFRPESLLGEGGFGCVFKGWIEEHGTAPVKPGTGLTVAVKTLNLDGLQGHKEWMAEVSFLSDLIHPHLVKLIGYCNEDDQRLLVYEFMPRGSLENHLFRRSLPLPWSIRMKIALGAAKGLAFLHEEAARPVIYRDFKTSNILLDAEYNCKLSDFGLAKDGPEGDKTHVSTRVMGTYGYAAPEYVMTGHLTTKSDVYGFGVVLLEMLTGRRSMDKHRPNGEQNLVEWTRPYLADRKRFYRLIDPRLDGHFSIKGSQTVVNLAAVCLNRDPKARPQMSEIVEILKPLQNLKDMASSSYFFQTMQADRARPNPATRNGARGLGGPGPKNGHQKQRSFNVVNGSTAHSPNHNHQHKNPAPKANGKP